MSSSFSLAFDLARGAGVGAGAGDATARACASMTATARSIAPLAMAVRVATAITGASEHHFLPVFGPKNAPEIRIAVALRLHPANRYLSAGDDRITVLVPLRFDGFSGCSGLVYMARSSVQFRPVALDDESCKWLRYKSL
jgi:hypothetical protein